MERAQEQIRGTVLSFEKVQSALERAGIEFLDPQFGAGVRLKPSMASSKT